MIALLSVIAWVAVLNCILSRKPQDGTENLLWEQDWDYDSNGKMSLTFEAFFLLCSLGLLVLFVSVITICL